MAKTYNDLYRFANLDILSLYDWLCLNKLSLNLGKTKYILYSLSSRGNQPPDHLCVTLNDSVVERVDNFKFLGLYIDQNLSWKTHMTKLLSKIQRNLGIVRKISCFLNRKSLMQLFHSLIMSHIRYGITVWHHGQVVLRKKKFKHILINF